METNVTLGELSERIDFHKRWRGIWSLSYFTSSAVTIVAAACATVAASLITDTGEGKYVATGLALAATILTSLEKVLKMREKWDLHRNSYEALRILRLRMSATTPEELQFIDQLEMISQSYSLQLSDLNHASSTQESGE